MPLSHTLRRLAVSGFVILMAAGCASQGEVSRSNLNSTVAINYGTIASVTPVQLQSNATRNATIGGLAGLATQARGSTRQRLTGAAIGTAIGGLGTRAIEGSNRANSFVIDLTRGGTVQVVTEQQNIVVGDCVAVESGRHTNLRRVSGIQCQPVSQPHPGIDPQISQNEQNEATACDRAMEELLQARKEQEIDALIRKVRVLCDH